MRVRPLTATTALAVGLMGFGAAPAANAEPASTLSILATTDIHGHVFNWDYFADAEYPAGATQPLGMSRAATIIDGARTERGADSVLVVDNGDSLQGTPLTYLAARQPSLLSDPSRNPIAHAYNVMGTEVQVVGNHEFNYGLSYLAAYESQLDATLLGANVLDAATGEPALTPSTVVRKTVDGHQVDVGVIGVTTPGSAVWDKAIVEGKLDFVDPIEAARAEVAAVRAKGADVVIALAHTGLDSAGASPIVGDLQENFGTTLAKKVEGLDVVVIGHTHQDNPSTLVDGASGHAVLVTQPAYWARSVADIQIPLTFSAEGAVQIDRGRVDTWATQDYTADEVESAAFTSDALLAADHRATVDYVNSVVAASTEEMRTDRSMVEDSKILDFIGRTQEDAVRDALRGTRYADVPVIAQVSPFSRAAVFPKGDVRIKDIAGLYVFDNTLGAIELNGAQVRDYLEYSAKYFKQAKPGETVDPDTHTQAEHAGTTVWDYNYDALTGVTYAIDITRPVGDRIRHLLWKGKEVTDDQRFILAVNNYRMNGGGAYPHVTEAPVVWNDLVEIRQLLIDTASADKVIDPENFAEVNWMVTTDASKLPSWVTGEGGTVEPSPEPTTEPSIPSSLVRPVRPGPPATGA